MPPGVLLRYQWSRLLSRIHRWRVAAASGGSRFALAKTFAATRSAAGSADLRTASGSSLRGTILFVDSTLPRADRDSGSLRTCNLMRLMVAEGYRVHFLAEDRSGGAPAVALRDMGVDVCHRRQGATIPSWFAAHARDCAAVVISRHHLAYWIPMARRLAPQALIVFDTVDLHHLREEREARVAGNRRLLAVSRATCRREMSAVQNADVSWVVSRAEEAMVEKLVPGARVVVVPNLHDVEPDTPGPDQRSGLLFIGGGRHPPNVDAVAWLVTEVFPRIRERLPGCTLEIVGEELENRLGAAALDNAGVTFHGHVPDLTVLLRRCRIALAPLRFGAGVKGKVNQYMAHGVPTVATPCATEGMHLRHGVDVLVAEGAAEFAEAVTRLDEDSGLWLSLARNGKENVRRHFSLDSAREPLAKTFGESLKQVAVK